ncbi:MAG: sigma-70 family RNA polymerase sigma factor, partial [Ruminococcus sp.]|nr:sigma-70 family RNA polymerase sigma factor [Ruminococcus sp.]
GKEGSSLRLIDMLADTEDVAERTELLIRCEELTERIESRLDEREKQIIKLRYGLTGDAPLTQRETASMLSISRSYVSRIEKKALEKLRK